MIKGSDLITNDELSMSDIDELISDCKVSIRLYQRLIFLKFIKKGFNIREASDFVGVVRQTGARWLKGYNNNGLDGLMPKFGGGRPSFLTDNQKDELRKIITSPDANYSIMQIRNMIHDKYDVDYTYKQVWVIVRVKFGLNYTKPFPNYDNSPETAREDLKKTQQQ
jgi:putative transposase